jgi:hypothetical protein
MIYRASPIKRERRTKKRMAQLDDQIVKALSNDHPQSVRHVFYLMTNPRLLEPVEKSDRGYDHAQSRCVKLRRSGHIPYGWFADMSRRGYYINTFDDAGDFLRQMNGLYRADLWRDAEYRCEVWVESRSIASVLIDDCKELAVSLFPCGGFPSLSFVHDATQQINQSGDTRPLMVFYVGDYDPAGILIDVALQREMRKHLNPEIELSFIRVGINEAQVQDYDLPTKARKKGDKRSQHMTYTVEAEAMPARILRGLLRAHVEALSPEGALASSKVAEQSERAHIERMAAMFDLGAL